MKYPEHEKIAERRDEHNAIVLFCEWLEEHGRFGLSTYVSNYSNTGRPWMLSGEEIRSVIAEYFDVDLSKIEKEEMQMLAEYKAQKRKAKKTKSK